MTKEQKRDYAKTKQREQMQGAIQALAMTDGFQAWLRARKCFHEYSWRNQLLIALQHDHPTRVRGFRQWREDFNRQVVKGAKAIWILAPMTKKTGEKLKDGSDEKRLFFRSVKVFDVSDTAPIEGLPEIPLTSPIKGGEMEGDSHSWAIPQLEVFAAKRDIDITYEPLDAGHGGTHLEGHITINSTWSTNAQVRVLIHELAHDHEVNYVRFSRETAELICDTVAWMVCDTIGLDASDSSFAYVTNWSGGNVSDLEAFAKLIDGIAKSIEDALTPPSEETP